MNTSKLMSDILFTEFFQQDCQSTSFCRSMHVLPRPWLQTVELDWGWLEGINESIIFCLELILFLILFLPALKGYFPDDMIHALQGLIDFCYLAYRDVLDTKSLAAMQDALDHFPKYFAHVVFAHPSIYPNNTLLCTSSKWYWLLVPQMDSACQL